MDKKTPLQVYGALLIVGGSMGYLKRKSIPSLVAGAGSGVAVILLANDVARNDLALKGITLFLTLLMGFRAAKSGKFMPAGLVAALSGIAFAGLMSS